MVITCSTSGAGSCERARILNIAVELSGTAWRDSAPSVFPSRSALAQRGFCSLIGVTDMVSSGDLQEH